jgi:hypothetical protein
MVNARNEKIFSVVQKINIASVKIACTPCFLHVYSKPTARSDRGDVKKGGNVLGEGQHFGVFSLHIIFSFYSSSSPGYVPDAEGVKRSENAWKMFGILMR